ncbi:hypothetical protein CLV24_10680 [Pontibacter ummariensis]|uniref:Uncharacterized protein n=1 Tax=Pontibacter ummariensis TaxID=1610492 RepID=A0A239EB46_9BACT|nr:hypothetical protein [Pontibacter ummariensis]PRY13166.1 hypothetical protein CLV24_10680 [Pontibacter ummariensis]SNS41729.1 hypothetical protein SAMN06296052_10680 [Pontibacter ummariensis]
MPYSPAIVTSATNHLQRVFDIENLPGQDLEALQYKLARVVLHLLHSDLNRLLHILYRIDVEEHKVKEAMVADDPETIAERIARLIIKRELRKAEIRDRYRQR